MARKPCFVANTAQSPTNASEKRLEKSQTLDKQQIKFTETKGEIMQEYGYGHWDIVFLNIVLFSLFALTIPFKKKVGRRSGSAYLAFIIVLYAEMYGFPLTIYFLTWLFNYQNPLTHLSGHILAGVVGEDFFFLFLHPLSVSMMVLGASFVIVGWQKIHIAKDRLVTDGIYRYVRHPQYLGFLLLTSGMLVQWVTIPTALMWPILVVLYYRLAMEEEKGMEERFGKEYLEYKRRVPMFMPLFARNRKLPSMNGDPKSG